MSDKTDRLDEILNKALERQQKQPQYQGHCEWCGEPIEFWCDRMEILYNDEYVSRFSRDEICTSCFRKVMELKNRVLAESSKYVKTDIQ
jgi:hypothetical protein